MRSAGLVVVLGIQDEYDAFLHVTQARVEGIHAGADACGIDGLAMTLVQCCRKPVELADQILEEVLGVVGN